MVIQNILVLSVRVFDGIVRIDGHYADVQMTLGETNGRNRHFSCNLLVAVSAIGPRKDPGRASLFSQADRARDTARSSRIRSFGADGNPTTATLCFHYCHLMIQISVCDGTNNLAVLNP